MNYEHRRIISPFFAKMSVIYNNLTSINIMIGVILKNMRALLLAYYKRELLCFFCEHNLSKLRCINILWNEAKPMATAQN